MKKIYYTSGQILGNNIVFLNEIERTRKNYVRAIFQCHCGNKFECDISQIKSFNTKSCGCLNTPEIIAKRETKHGLYGHTVYKKWISMNERCYRMKADNYNKYGGRGIQVCNLWRNDFMEYYKYIISLENYDELLLKQNLISIDRIDNNSHYEPGNLRITSWHVQSVNQRKQKNNTSGTEGISFVKKLNKWQSRITVHGTRFYLGVFADKQNAINKRLEYINDNNLVEYL
jgi:hypothetical protein